MAAPPITERHRPHFHRKAPMLESVRVATTANITIATALNAGDTLDGITLAADDRVLVKDQTTGSGNGIYVVSASPARAYDQSTDDPAFGFLVYVREGTTNGGTLWKNTNTTAPTIDTTALTFAAAGGTPTGAAGGDLSGSYPNPSVTDDSHSHTASTLPATPEHAHIDNVLYSGDAVTTAFTLPAAPVDAYSVAAYVAGVRTDVTLSGTLLDTMTFGTAPASGTDNITVDIAAVLG